MNNKINILHLSDLHFGAEPNEKVFRTAIAKRKNVLNSFFNVFENLDETWWPDIIVISGDIVWRGKKEDYQFAKGWISDLLNKLNLTSDELIICAGNHDLDRDKTAAMFRPPNCAAADTCLEIEKLDNLVTPFSEYNLFCEDMKIPKLSIGERKYFLMGQREINGINFIVLNSSWFSRDDEDSGNLYIGSPHLEVMKSENQLINPEKYDSEPISISILHHPFDKLAENEKYSYDRNSTYSYLSEHSHIILSGHTHNQTIAKPDRKFNTAWLFVVGSTYSSDDYFNNFSILQIDKNKRTVKRVSYGYDPRSREWIEKQDTHSYDLKINKVELERTEINCSWKNYCGAIKNDFKTIKDISAIGQTALMPLEDMYVYLRLSETDNILEMDIDLEKSGHLKDEFIKFENEKRLTKGKIFDSEKAVKDFDKLVLVGDPGSGKTTLLRHVALKKQKSSSKVI